MKESAREIVAVLRDEKRVSQRELARMLGVMPYVVCRWGRGESVPSADNMRRLVAIYERLQGVEIRYIGQAADYLVGLDIAKGR